MARQPYFRETDGELIRQPGYDKIARRFGVFDARHFVIPDPTPDAAQAALALLEELLTEFHFVAATDKAAALAAIFTAVVRPTLPHAPAFHVRAPVSASGKTYLCELIGAFAGPGGNAKVCYRRSTAVKTALLGGYRPLPESRLDKLSISCPVRTIVSFPSSLSRENVIYCSHVLLL